MITVTRIATAAIILAWAAGCDNVFGLFGSDDASVEADLTSEVLSMTIRNEGDDTILFQGQCNFIERREDGGWRGVTGTPIPVEGVKVFCTQQLGPPTRVEAGEEYRQEWEKADQWQPGEYRFKLELTDEGGRTLSDDARTSNTFQIGSAIEP